MTHRTLVSWNWPEDHLSNFPYIEQGHLQLIHVAQSINQTSNVSVYLPNYNKSLFSFSGCGVWLFSSLVVCIMYSDLYLCMVEKKFKGVGVSWQFSLLNDRNFVSFPLPHLWLFVLNLLSLQYISQSEPAAPDRKCLWLAKEGGLAKPIRLKLGMEFWNLVWLAQHHSLPEVSRAVAQAFRGSVQPSPSCEPSSKCLVVWAAGSCRRERCVFNIMIKYEEETPCSS